MSTRNTHTVSPALAGTNPSRLTVADVKGLIDRKEPITFIDSRNPIAWGSSNVILPGALRIPIDEVERHLQDLPRDRRLIVYCT
jgi:rhodanese-related sulfurtransferase